MHTEKQEEDSTTQVKTFEDKPTKKISKPKKEKVTKREIKSPNKRKQSTKGSIASPRQTRKKTSSVKPKRSKGRRVSKATTSSKGTVSIVLCFFEKMSDILSI